MTHHGNLRGPPQGHPPQEIAGPNKALLRETNGYFLREGSFGGVP